MTCDFPERFGSLISLLSSETPRLLWVALKPTPLFLMALSALKELQMAWEKKHNSPKYALYKDVLIDGLAKVGKYYSHLDEKPSFVFALGKASKQIH